MLLPDHTIRILLANDKLICKAILDSGADAARISKNTLNKLMALDKHIQTKPLDPCVNLQLPNSEKIKVNCAVNIDIKINTQAGQLLLNNQE